MLLNNMSNGLKQDNFNKAGLHLVSMSVTFNSVQIEKINDFMWRIPKHGKMRVDGIVFASEKLMESIREDKSLEQVANVATLPGIVGASLAMPDIHWGYGFPIGGVAAFDPNIGGIISPGGVGYDINCGVRLLKTDVDRKDVSGKIKDLVQQLFHHIPVGIGKGHKGFKLSRKQLEEVAIKGAGWAVESGYGTQDDLDHLESRGVLDWADSDAVPNRAYERGALQLGSVGSGNHFVEIDFVDEIYDEALAQAIGLEKDQIVIQIHSGSRGFGHQTCTDYLPIMIKASQKYEIELVDKQLCCAPLNSPEGQKYFGAMAAAANYAFANRQMITQWVREIFEKFFGSSYEKLGIKPIYDVCHNIAKWEEHVVEGKKRRLCVHRKGATRAYPKGHPELPEVYRELGQPVLIPGDMGRYSFVLIGEAGSMEKTFGSSCHGAGRMMSRHAAAKACKGRNIQREMEDKGIYVRGASMATVVEEVSEAYKDVANVVDVVAGAGLSKKVCRLKPLGVIKG